MVFHAWNEVQVAAREEYKDYINDVMSSSLSKNDLQVTHNCGEKETAIQSNYIVRDDNFNHPQNDNNVKVIKETGAADELFYDFIKDGPDETKQLQRYRIHEASTRRIP